MKNSKTKSATIVLVLLMASAVLMITSPVQAQPAAEQPTIEIPSGVTPNTTYETIAQLSFRPRIVGIGQTVLVNYWIHTANLIANYKYIQ